MASLNHKYLYEKQLSTYKRRFLCNQSFDQFVNVFWNWWPVERTKRNLKKIIVCSSNAKERKGILQKTLIVFHAVLALLQETSRYQRLSLLHCSASLCRNQGVGEVREHALPSACRRRTVSLRPRTQIRRRKRYLKLPRHMPVRS